MTKLLLVLFGIYLYFKICKYIMSKQSFESLNISSGVTELNLYRTKHWFVNRMEIQSRFTKINSEI